MKRLDICAAIALLLPFSLSAQTQRDADFHSKYKLEEVVVFSRHNVRSPITDENSILGKLTPHKWIDWSSAASELTLKGGVLETINGQFFRKWLVNEGLFEENARPSGDEVHFYANSKQRTIATARYFLSGFLPVSDIQVEWKEPYDKMNPDFDLALYGVTDELRDRVNAELEEIYGKNGLKNLSKSLKDSYSLLSDVLDFKDSPARKEGLVKDFKDHDVKMILQDGKEPAFTGSLSVAMNPADALMLQYYEDPDPRHAMFGHKIKESDIKEIGRLQDTKNHLNFAAPSIYRPLGKKYLGLIADELCTDGRKFAFLCGHDTNIVCILNTLGIEEYEAPDAIEVHTPIGSKIVFEKWVDADGRKLVAINHVYQTVSQIRNNTMLTGDERPQVIPVKLKLLQTNPDGLYYLNDLIRYIEAQ